jgi:hypothetical protein
MPENYNDNTERLLEVYSYFQKLTSQRKIGYNTEKHIERVVDGYNVIMSVVGRFRVNTAQSSN